MPDNIFTRVSLGDLVFGRKAAIDKQGVDNMLLDAAYSTNRCMICGYSTPKYRLVPKAEAYNNAAIQNNGCVCEHCLRTCVSPDQYGIQEL
jgi:hypothetical protein